MSDAGPAQTSRHPGPFGRDVKIPSCKHFFLPYQRDHVTRTGPTIRSPTPDHGRRRQTRHSNSPNAARFTLFGAPHWGMRRSICPADRRVTTRQSPESPAQASATRSRARSPNLGAVDLAVDPDGQRHGIRGAVADLGRSHVRDLQYVPPLTAVTRWQVASRDSPPVASHRSRHFRARVARCLADQCEDGLARSADQAQPVAVLVSKSRATHGHCEASTGPGSSGLAKPRAAPWLQCSWYTGPVPEHVSDQVRSSHLGQRCSRS